MFPANAPSEGVDTTPLLSNSIADHLFRSRRLLRRPSPPFRGSAARLLRRASSRRMMLREPSVRVRENAAEQLEERQSDWAHSKPIIALDVLWNLAFVVVALVVLSLSVDEKPGVPLRLWIAGYGLQCLFHVGCVILEYRRRREGGFLGFQNGGESTSDNAGECEDCVTENLQYGNETSIPEPTAFRDAWLPETEKHLESANTMFSFIWWVIGFYWVTADGEALTRDSPQLYWLCVAFLAFDVVFVMMCVLIACLVGIAVCCCLPCILAILYALRDREGATEEEINRLPKYRFLSVSHFEKANGAVLESILESYGGLMTQCDADTPIERILPSEASECCICLTAYEDGAELRELPCNHHFHSTCIDKWLCINATCPLCKFNILKSEDQKIGEEAV